MFQKSTIKDVRFSLAIIAMLTFFALVITGQNEAPEIIKSQATTGTFPPKGIAIALSIFLISVLGVWVCSRFKSEMKEKYNI